MSKGPMLSLSDLDFDPRDKQSLHEKERRDALNEIKETRRVLGKMTLRDSMEAVYGSAYTMQMLGEDGGKDILVEEMNANEDRREEAGMDRRDIGGNRLPSRRASEMSKGELGEAVDALSDQEAVAEAAAIASTENWFQEDANDYRAQNGDQSYEDLIRDKFPEQADEIIALLEAAKAK